MHNPKAGLALHPMFAAVITALEDRGAQVIRAPEGTGGTLPFSAEEYDAVIAAGGDGTIRALAASAGRCPVGILPVGTGNVLAREIGLPKTAEGIADVLITGPVLDIEVARANGETVLLMAGVGFDGEVVRRLDIPLKRRVGMAAYAGALLSALRAPLPELMVTIDGETHVASWVVVANARRYGGPFTIAPSAGLLRQGLEVVLFKSRGKAALLRQLLALAAGRVGSDPDVTVLSATTVTVEADPEAPVQIDGDIFGVTPLRVEAGGPSLRLIVPQAYATREPDR